MTISNRFKRPVVRILAAGVLLADPAAGLARLRPETVDGWQRYVTAVEQRRQREDHDPRRFLVMDFQATGDRDRRAVLAGEITTESLSATDGSGRGIDVQSGRVHHWRGAVLIRGVGVNDLLSRIEHADPPAVQDDVLQSRVLSREPGRARVYLKLQRKKIVTVVYNTEHDVRFVPVNGSRAMSTSVATKIAEVREAGSSSERELTPGDDRGFLWRLNGYWRYEAVPGGVIAECESISLSRSIPFGFQYLIGPLAASTAREAMESTLIALRTRFAKTPSASSSAR
jgi:hypothetical protein